MNGCNNCAYAQVREEPCVNCSLLDKEKPNSQWSQAGSKWCVDRDSTPAPKPNSKTATDLLKDATDTLNARGVDYDKPIGERSMAKTVAVFNLLTDNNLTEAEGWQFMKCLKQARNWSGDKRHADSMVDDIAYSALLAECATNV